MSIRVNALCFLFATAIGFSSCNNRTANLPDYGPVPEFAMTDSKGHAFDSNALLGKAWVADFIYTNCPAACPMMTSKMRGIEKQIRGDKDVRLVSISVDPARDTPPVLNAFAERFGGPTAQWVFLTGTPATVHQVAFTTFHVGDVVNKINHSTKFILVDKRAHIRGYYSSVDATGDDLPKLIKDLTALGAERP